jgi:hypothetical protein
MTKKVNVGMKGVPDIESIQIFKALLMSYLYGVHKVNELITSVTKHLIRALRYVHVNGWL